MKYRKYAPSIIQGVADKFWTTLYYIIIFICQNTQVIHAVFNKERVFSFCLKNKEGLLQSVESHLKCFHPRRCLLRNCIALSRHQQQQKAKCFDQPSTPLQQQKTTPETLFLARKKKKKKWKPRVQIKIRVLNRRSSADFFVIPGQFRNWI